MRFQVRSSSENQNGSSELKHYGVKGMKWGVRKEYESSGKKKSYTSKDLGVEESIVSKWSKIDERLGVGAGIVRSYQSMLNPDNNTYERKFENFIKEVESGSSSRDPNLNKFLKDYTDATGKNINRTEYRDLLSSVAANKQTMGFVSKKSWSEVEDANAIWSTLLDYYRKVYSQIPDEEDEEEQRLMEEASELRDKLQKAISDAGIIVHDKQHIYIQIVDGANAFIYDDGSGNQYGARPDQLSTLIDIIARDAKALRDPRNSRTREKNVTGKATSVKKREASNEQKEVMGKAKPENTHTYLSDHDAVNKAILRARGQKALETVKNTDVSSMLSRQEDMKKRAKEIKESKSIKNVMKKKLSNVKESASSSIKKATEFVKGFFEIKTVTTTTHGNAGLGSTTTTTVKKKK